jgi:hypothetical protein
MGCMGATGSETEYVRAAIMARSLIADYRRAWKVLVSILEAGEDEEGMRVHLADANRVYDAIWAQLDHARDQARLLAMDLPGFDELREQRERLASGVDYDGNQLGLVLRVKVARNDAGIALAEQCADRLRAAAPHLPWDAEQRQLDALGDTNLMPSRGSALLVRVLAIAAVAALALWIAVSLAS